MPNKFLQRAIIMLRILPSAEVCRYALINQ